MLWRAVLRCCSNWGAACPNIKAAIKKLDKLLRRVKVSGVEGAGWVGGWVGVGGTHASQESVMLS